MASTSALSWTMSSEILEVTSMRDERAPTFYQRSQAKRMELLGENNYELLKPALRSYFRDVECLRLTNGEYLRSLDVAGCRRCQDWFREAIDDEDYPFLLGITLACLLTALQLWMAADPQRAFLKLSEQTGSGDFNLRDFLALALRRLFGCDGDHPLSALRCVDHFRRLAVDDSVGFKIALGSVKDEDRRSLLDQVERGLKDEILSAASEGNPLKLYNAFRFALDYGFRRWPDVAAAIDADHGRVFTDYFRQRLRRNDVAGINHLLVYACSFLGRRGPRVEAFDTMEIHGWSRGPFVGRFC